MAIPRQFAIKDMSADQLDDLSKDPQTPGIPLAPQEEVPAEQHRNGKSNTRLQENVNLISFPNNNEDTNESAASLDVCTGDSFNSFISECSLLKVSGNYETDKEHSEIHSGLATDMSHGLDKFLIDDLFTQSFDFELDTKPRLYTPDFSTGSSEIDTLETESSIESSTLPCETLQSQSDSFNVTDSTESTTHLKTRPSYPSKQTPMENQFESASSKRSCAFLNSYFRADSIYSSENVNPTVSVETIPSSDTESEEQDDICNTLKSRRQDVYLAKLKELEEEVNHLQQLQKKDFMWTKAAGISNPPRPMLSSQRSVSENDIYYPMELENIIEGLVSTSELNEKARDDYDIKKSQSTDNVNSRTKRDRCSEIKDDQPNLRTFSSFENIKSKATKLWGKIIKRDESSSDESSQKLSIKVDDRVKLSCPCGKSCKSIKSLVTAQGGYMWVTFKQCSWISLYNDKHEKVFMFDTRGSVDSMAVSSNNVLYISCPPQKRIIMLSSELQDTVLRSFSKMYPRGVAVSPDDDTLVVCLVSQTVGNVMKSPSKDSCLMQFKGKTSNEKGKIINKENHFGYPVKVTINTNGFLLVSDFGLRCLFLLDKGGNMLRTFSSLGGGPLWHVHALTSNPINSFYIIQGGAGTLSITRLGEYLGTFEEKSTSTKEEPLLKQKIDTASMATDGQIAIATGNVIIHVSLIY